MTVARQQAVTVEGMDKLARVLKGLPAAVGEGARKAVREETGEVVADMRRTAPRDTGELIASMHPVITNDGLSGQAVATARHATFVEHGTEDTPEQPFATPAAERSRKRFPDRIKTEVGGMLKGLLQ
ncbi:HK97-gp10 family putative phage morphogenesis protein [Micromonospora sp. NPDC048999]|uniref:HK97-gp10 family putative phage morphogenesis protein n=1 Tax=Micromonospora sp. NPDC048999 TaxID=3155391 RepID=UPI0033E50F3A